MKTILIALISFAALNAHSAAAVEYKCVGVNRLDRSALEYTLNFDTYDQDAGYTNQTITVTKVGDKAVKNPTVLQMFGANKSNNCKSELEGEIYFDGKQGQFEMGGSDKNSTAYVVTFKSACAGHEYDVVSVCDFE